MPQPFATVYPTQMPSLSDLVNIQAAFTFYHFGRAEEGSIPYRGMTGHLHEIDLGIQSVTAAANSLDGNVDVAEEDISDINTEISNTATNTMVSDLSLKADVYRPVGSVMMWAGNTIPTGWLECDGSPKLKSDYLKLFQVIGDTYSQSSGTVFYLPNLKGRIPVGFDSSQTEFSTMGKTGGEKSVAITLATMPVHNHAGSVLQALLGDGQHSHNASIDPASGNHTHTGSTSKDSHRHSFTDSGTGTVYAITYKEIITSGTKFDYVADNVSSTDYTSYDEHKHTFSIGSSGSHTHTTTIQDGGAHTHTITVGNSGGGVAHTNLQPYIVLRYIIKALA
jgi:microcystin-dependent protein